MSERDTYESALSVLRSEVDRLTRENADLRARLAEAEKDRDEQAEAKRLLARELAWLDLEVMPPELWEQRAKDHDEMSRNAIAVAALKEARVGNETR